ncbi:hypothetical protein NC652_006447 [Populus alba x Populus x berolinensis]|nr:hypothetical protein NC652_006447 [Populus alba x Populus x berolinensis]
MQGTEDLHSVSSPRRVLSFSKRRKATVSFLDPDDKAVSGFGVSGDHGPKSSEVYGFVGSITTVVATAIFFVWAYVPENWLQAIGIFYYPNKYWALAVPTYGMVTILLALLFYVWSQLHVNPTPYFLEHNLRREPSTFIPSREGYEQPIEPISDIGIDKIIYLMFNDVK